MGRCGGLGAGGNVKIKADVAGMANGQRAGLCIFHGVAAQLGIVQRHGQRIIELQNAKKSTLGPRLYQNLVWLEVRIGNHVTCRFAWSLNGKQFHGIGGQFKLGWANYRGTRLGIYCYNNRAAGGYFDVDYCHYIYPHPGR